MVLTLLNSVSQAPTAVGAPNPQLTFILPLTLVFPTATRTPTPINIGNRVWDDLDADGQQDAGEPGLAGVTVQLWNADKTDLIASDSTDASGIYAVVAPTPGTYRVRVVLPNILDSFSGKDLAGGDDIDDSDINPSGSNIGFTDIISIASNVISISSIDAGIIVFRTPTPTRTPTPINLGNLVWDDLDADGQQDAGEPGLAGVTVQLWSADKTDLIASDLTDASGIYAVIAPTPGTYRIRVVLPHLLDSFTGKDLAGGDDTDDSDINPSGSNIGFTDIISIASNVISISSIDAGIVVFKTPTPTRTPTPINLGNFVWRDTNANGIQDAGETGVGAAQVQLWNSTKTALIDTAVTNASGIYTLVAPTPGSYRIRIVLPGGITISPKNQGADDTKDNDVNPNGVDLGFTDAFTIASNVISISSLDIGLTNAPASFATPTATLVPPTATATRTPTRTPTRTATPAPTLTPLPPGFDQRVYLPSLMKE